MENANNLQKVSKMKRFFQGAGIAALLLGLTMVLGEHNAPINLRWILRWVVIPLIFVSIAGGMGGIVYYYTKSFLDKGKKQKILAIVFTAIIYIILVSTAFVFSMNGPN